MTLPAFHDPETERLFAEATAALKSGEQSVRLIPPETGKLLSGPTRFDTLVTGTVEKVVFSLDDKKILTKNRPPYNVEVDLGAFPSVHTLRAEALDAAGAEVATDQLILNSGGYRFVAKLREPRPGKTLFVKSLQARVEVEVPGGRSLDRVELYLNENKVATLYQEPFVQAIVLPQKEEVGYVRAVAYLPDGNSTEDLVVHQRAGRASKRSRCSSSSSTPRCSAATAGRCRAWPADDFKVLEDGVEQKILRFEQVEDLPIHVGVMIDTSASMVGILDEVRRAALAFFERSLEPKDRAAVITFSSFPRLQVELTGDQTQLGRGLAGLAPEGKTALYDSLMYGLYYFAGIKGQRAILLLSDGKRRRQPFRLRADPRLRAPRRGDHLQHRLPARRPRRPRQAAEALRRNRRLELLHRRQRGDRQGLRDHRKGDALAAAARLPEQQQVRRRAVPPHRNEGRPPRRGGQDPLGLLPLTIFTRWLIGGNSRVSASARGTKRRVQPSVCQSSR